MSETLWAVVITSGLGIIGTIVASILGYRSTVRSIEIEITISRKIKVFDDLFAAITGVFQKQCTVKDFYRTYCSARMLVSPLTQEILDDIAKLLLVFDMLEAPVQDEWVQVVGLVDRLNKRLSVELPHR